MPTVKTYVLVEKFTGAYIASISYGKTRTVNVIEGAEEFIFENDDEGKGFCKAVKRFTNQTVTSIRKRNNETTKE